MASILALALLVPACIATYPTPATSTTVPSDQSALISSGPRTTNPSIQLSVSSQRVNEEVGDATVTAQLSAASNYTVTVSLATSNGTALANADYAPVNMTVAFPPGITTVSVAIPIIDDPVDEPDQTFTVSVSNPTNAILGTTASTTITIVDNDPPPLASWMTYIFGATESSGFADVIIYIDTPSDYVVTVQYATSNITAKAGSDYIAASGTATLTPGQTYIEIHIPIATDTVPEPDEDFALTLSNPVNATLHYYQAIVRIHNSGPTPSPVTSSIITLTTGTNTPPTTATLTRGSYPYP